MFSMVSQTINAVMCLSIPKVRSRFFAVVVAVVSLISMSKLIGMDMSPNEVQSILRSVKQPLEQTHYQRGGNSIFWRITPHLKRRVFHNVEASRKEPLFRNPTIKIRKGGLRYYRIPPPQSAGEHQTNIPDGDDDNHAVDILSLEHLSVKELRVRLKDKGCTVSGTKAELIQRLKLALRDDDDEEDRGEGDATVEVSEKNVSTSNSQQEREKSIEVENDTAHINPAVPVTSSFTNPPPPPPPPTTSSSSSSSSSGNSDEGGTLEMLTRFPGVIFRQKSNKWEAHTNYGEKQLFVGLFPSEEDAWGAIQKRREKLRWPPLTLEEGYMYAFFPGLKWDESKRLWIATTKHWTADDHEEFVGEFASRAEAWFEVRRFRKEKNWPEISTTPPVQTSIKEEEETETRNEDGAESSSSSLSPSQSEQLSSSFGSSPPKDSSSPSTATNGNAETMIPENLLKEVGGEEEKSQVINDSSSTLGTSSSSSSSNPPNDDDEDYDEMIYNSNLLALSVSELKEEARRRNLSPRGKKIDIVARLERAMAIPDTEFDKPAKVALMFYSL